MKRLASILLTLLLLLNLVGCVPADTPLVSDGGNAEVSQSTTTTSMEGVVDGGSTTTTEDHSESPTTTQNGGGQADTTTQKPISTTVIPKPTTTTTRTPTTTKSDGQMPTVDKAFALTGSQTLQATLYGTVVSVREAYSAGYNNATFTIRVQGTAGAKELLCYRCKPAGATDVAVGQSVSLTGTIKNYNGTIEFDKATYTITGGAAVTTTTTTHAPVSGSIDENGIYDSKEDVALYIHIYGKLPKNYVTKSQYNKDKYLCVGGDRFYNKEGLLPNGETYYECDIDTYGSTSRGAKRLVWTKSGIVYYTSDHYASFTKMYGER